MRTLWAIPLLIVAGNVQAERVRVEVGAGLNDYNIYSDGTWYQLGEPHHIRHSSPFYTLGLTQSFAHHFAWHADFIDFGTAHSECLCTADENYDFTNHRVKDMDYPVKPAKFIGSGGSKGISLTLDWGDTYKSWRYGLNGGVLAYRDSWVENVYDWTSIGQKEPIFVSLKTSNITRAAPVFGVYLGNGPWTIRYSVYTMKHPSPSGPAVPPLWHDTQSLYVTYEF